MTDLDAFLAAFNRPDYSEAEEWSALSSGEQLSLFIQAVNRLEKANEHINFLYRRLEALKDEEEDA